MKRKLVALTAPLLAAALLAGCGSDADQAAGSGESSPSGSPSSSPSESSDAAAAPGNGTKYCELLSTDFATLFANIQGPDDVDRAIGVVGELADEAPSEVSDEWSRMEGAFSDMRGALVKAAELQKKAQEGEITQKQLQKRNQALMEELDSLDTKQNQQAGQKVARHAAEYCGLKLG